ncbi:MAG: hypothetical protein KKF46_07745 [Nanoarchaeota archaeon]|nr:hypothetical protein [Nanoarchaeota archaeon]MBU1322221.1 hypothetical protein [Nanoarchaeota archaeon]MBU1597762.1 hypothetical protein [Nanoarchaeota archaeon]MBU2442026.1 hypothetical protein [Nanoarchaeota archaeon]
MTSNKSKFYINHYIPNKNKMKKLQKILVGVGATVILWMGVEFGALSIGVHYKFKGVEHKLDGLIYKLDGILHLADFDATESQREKNQELANEDYQKGIDAYNKGQAYFDKGDKYVQFAKSMGPLSNIEKLVKEIF